MKRLFTILIALILLTITIYSASAIQIVEIQNQQVHVGSQYSYNVELAEDAGNLTYALSGPSNMEISPNGVISWVPSLSNIGNHTVTVLVSNATANDEETFTLEVIYSQFTLSLNTASAPASASPNSQYSFTLQASSNYPLAVDGYNYQLIEGPQGLTLSENVLTWTPNVNQSGTHSVTVSAIPNNAPHQMGPVTGTFSVNVQGLTIDRVEVRSGSRRLDTISRDNYLASSAPYVIARDANLGETIELRISVRNNLPSGNEYELRDIEIELYSFDLVNADGQSIFISRLRSGRTDDQTISFLLDPADLHPEDSPFDLELRVFGETRDGEFYSDVWLLDLRVEARSYNLLMTNLLASPSQVCAGERLRVSFNLRNIGTRDLSSAGVRFNLPELNINEWERNINLDYDQSRQITRFLTIPQNAALGEYYLEVIAHPRMTSTADTTSELLLFNVRACGPVNDDDDNDTIIITPPVDDVIVPGTPVSEAVGKRQSLFGMDNTVYIVLLTALTVLVLVGVILLLVSIFR
jgi:hypothetical protein